MTYLEKGVERSNLFHYTVLPLAWKTWEIHRILNLCKDSPLFRPGSNLWSREHMLNFGFNVTTSSAEVTWRQTGQEYDWELQLNAYRLRISWNYAQQHTNNLSWRNGPLVELSSEFEPKYLQIYMEGVSE
jgi:hypothetical protein